MGNLIAQDGSLLAFAGPKVTSNSKIVLSAISQSGLYFEFAHQSLKSNKSIIEEALKKDVAA